MSARRKQTSTAARARAAETAKPSPPPLLPRLEGPRIAHIDARREAARVHELDAVLAVVPDAAAAEQFKRLPEAERWQALHARAKPRPGTVRSTVLANRRQTLAVVGYVAADASAFDRLQLAGRMLKEAASRNPDSLGLAALGDRSASKSLEALLAAALAQAFHMPAYRARAADEKSIRRIDLLDTQGSKESSRVDIPFAVAAARGNNLVRWLTALPPNMLDASGYRTAVSRLAKVHGLGMRWLGEKALRRLGANAFLAVAAANEHRDAGIAHLSYRPRGRAGSPDLALIGKGILFDTGGVNLKTHRSMLDMHTDMSGSSVALATLLALAELRAPIAADAWLAITENQIGPKAYRPQEIVRASNGVTIQVIHTDAEGRMVLADTLSLAGRTKPRLMIDFATLTGAAVYSLTDRMSAVLTNRPRIAQKLVEAGRTSGERVWSFPLDSDYDSDLESKVADVLQCSVDGKGDHILATRFLNRFVPEDVAWAHVDLSSATRTGGLGHVNTDITGFGVRFALELIHRHGILADVERGK